MKQNFTYKNIATVILWTSYMLLVTEKLAIKASLALWQ